MGLHCAQSATICLFSEFVCEARVKQKLDIKSHRKKNTQVNRTGDK